MLLYSSDAPAGWNALPTPVKQKFYDIGQKGDWTAQEAYDHLVPDHLKDNPDEVSAWMDGDPNLGINDKDVSRIESGDNGGDYSTDNTVMEDMSVNRARGADNMSDAEFTTTVEANAVDAEVIEASFESASEASFEVVSNAEVFTESAATDILGDVLGTTGEILSNAVPPVILAMRGARLISKDPEEQLFAAGVIGTVTTIGMFTPAAPVIALGATACAGWSLLKLGINTINKHA